MIATSIVILGVLMSDDNVLLTTKSRQHRKVRLRGGDVCSPVMDLCLTPCNYLICKVNSGDIRNDVKTDSEMAASQPF